MACTGNCDVCDVRNTKLSVLSIVFFGFFASIFNIVGFVSPYWIIAGDGANTGFRRLGLWEICFENFIFPEDYVSKAYQGCWYVYYPEYKYIRFWLNPRMFLFLIIVLAWFYAVQILSIIALICNLAALIIIILTLCEMYIMNEFKQHFYIIGFQSVALGCFIFITTHMGIMSKDREWLPRADLNELSWSFAFAVLAGFFTIFCLFGVFTHCLSLKSKLIMEDPSYKLKLIESTNYNTKKAASDAFGVESKLGHGTATIPSLFTTLPSTYVGYSSKPTTSGLQAPGAVGMTTAGTSAANVSDKLRKSLHAQRAAVLEANALAVDSVENTAQQYNTIARQSTMDSRAQLNTPVGMGGLRETGQTPYQPSVAMDSAV